MSPRWLLLAVLVLPPSVLARGVHPRHLDREPEGARYALAEAFVFSEKAATFTLAPGEYRVAFSDRRAWYLIGPPRCLVMRVVPPKQPEAAYEMPFECGIKLPREAGQPADVFVVRGAPAESALGQGLLIDAIIKGGTGKFDFPARFDTGGELRARLRPAAGEDPGVTPAPLP